MASFVLQVLEPLERRPIGSRELQYLRERLELLLLLWQQ